MPSQYEQGPEAKAMETGFALDELMRRERGASKRQASQQTFERGMADVNQGHALDRLVKGDELKEAAAQKDAERSAPFLRTLISGNPQVAKTFGFGQNVTTPGESPVPEAGYAGTPDQTSFQPRTPTMSEATGLGRAVPNIASTLLAKSMDPNAGYTLNPGDVRFDALNRPIASNPKPLDNLQTEAEADKIIAENIARDPSLRGRITKEQTEKGAWRVKTMGTESMTESPSMWLSQSLDMLRPAHERIQAKMKYDQWLEDQAKLAGQKAFQTNVQTPFNAEDRKRQDTLEMTISSAYELMKFTAQDREQFTGAGKMGWEAARIAQEAGVPLGFGYTKEGVDRYSNFVKNNGMIEQYKFAIGGKQLTVGEQRVVESFIPTGRELTSSEYEAKLRTIAKVMEAARSVDQYLATTGKINVSTEAIRNIYKQELSKRGIDVTAPAEDSVKRDMSSGERLRSNFR